jgi:2-polyprenyl-3-methyl-5-hydroxy-6-metoxy-1,4-benzoquinol methylase
MDMQRANEETRESWDCNAAFWDERMGEGNDFVNVLCWPRIERLLAVKPGERVLDVACGNGLTSRRLAKLGAQVTAFDFSSEMIAHAQARSKTESKAITYLVLDGTDESGLLALGKQQFDAAMCNMALFDMAQIEPLFRALTHLLVPGGRFVFSVIHPCFNSPHMAHLAEKVDQEGVVKTTYFIKVEKYISPSINHGVALEGQPRAQLYFHRPLELLLAAGFKVGMVLDGMEEPTFPSNHPLGKNTLGWNANYHEFPPVLVARMCLPK